MFSVPGADAFALILLPMWSLVVNSWAFAVPFCRELPEGWGDTQNIGNWSSSAKGGLTTDGKGIAMGFASPEPGWAHGPAVPHSSC